MAPEYIVHGQLTEKADIYSYGVLLLEIVTGRKNHNSVATSADGHSLMSLVSLYCIALMEDYFWYWFGQFFVQSSSG